MDAIKFRTEFARMCSSYQTCSECAMPKECWECASLPANYTAELTSAIVKAVEDWSASHPVTTRADIFKKLYPDAALDGYGSLAICPFELNKNFKCLPDTDCPDCRKKYWSKEVQP